MDTEMLIGLCIAGAAVWCGLNWRGAALGLLAAAILVPDVLAAGWERLMLAVASDTGAGVIELAAVAVGVCVMVGVLRGRRAR